MGLLAAGAAFANSPFTTFCLGLFTPICPVPFSLNNRHTTPISLFPRQVKCTLLSLEDDYAFQHPVSRLDIYRKQSQQGMEEANLKNFWDPPMATTMKEANARLLFSSCGCTQEVKLNVKYQMALLSKKVNINFTNGIVSLAALYWVNNFKLCNKHPTLLARQLGFMMKKVLKEDIASQLDGIWQHRNLLDFTQLVSKNPEWFWEQVEEIISGIKKPK